MIITASIDSRASPITCKVIGQAKLISVQKEKESVKNVQWGQLCSEQDKFIAKNPDVRCSKINKVVHRAVQAKQVRSLRANGDAFVLTPKNYHETYRLLLHAEEAHEHIDMRKFDQYNARVRPSLQSNARDPLYEYNLAGLSKGHPNLIPGDTVILDDGVQPERFEIKNIKHDTIMFGRRKFNRDNGKNLVEDISRKLYKISFVTSGVTYDRYADNLKAMKGQKQFQHMIFEDKSKLSRGPLTTKQASKISLQATSEEVVDERLAKCNNLQRQAITNILEAPCRPSIYILFGPPGTGKTFTLVETVIQIFHRNSKVRVLISAGSNNCVDHLAEKICETGQIHKIIRLSSKTHFREMEIAGGFPRYYTTNPNEATQYRVVLTTNMMTCMLQSKFDYVLVDEAGHSHVPESMLPMSKVSRNGCFVLAGDPKQLGPVVKNHEVRRLGLGISLLERLFKFKVYSRIDGKYDPKYITKLTSSYRCDPRILGLCNKLFYDGDLECLGRTPPSLLKMFRFKKPLVFSQATGKEYTPRFSTSRGNNLEADICIEYIFRLYRMGFEPHQIGVITPYVLQREILMEKFDKKLNKHKSLLDERFKLPQESGEAEEKRERINESKSLTETLRGGHLKSPIDDLSFLTKALDQLRLQAVDNIEQSKPQYTDWHCKIDTVDAFQGNEREVIIISTVRTPNQAGAIEGGGFLADPKRFNVALSRAKWLVIVVGHGAVMNCCKLWKRYDWASCKSQIRF